MSEVAKLNTSLGQVMESVLIDGDLSKFTPEQRVVYYNKVCSSVGLNPLTRPFEYQRFNGKVQLYARKEASEQLRFIHGVSVYQMHKEVFNDVVSVTAYGRTKDGKEDVATGAVSIVGLKGEALANAHMKAETKAKRRLTLSICGLSFLDETEINTFPDSTPVTVNHSTGEIVAITATDVKKVAKTDDEILAGISEQKLNELAHDISNAKDILDLKTAYARAYVMHGLREELMPKLKELKDIRKKQIESPDHLSSTAFSDEQCPDLTGEVV